MIDWWLVIAEQTPEERAASIDRKESILANLETSVGGIRWIEKLVKEREAIQLLAGGYRRFANKTGYLRRRSC
jgi:hypothetical protein